jgi:hypothetical protein
MGIDNVIIFIKNLQFVELLFNLEDTGDYLLEIKAK